MWQRNKDTESSRSKFMSHIKSHFKDGLATIGNILSCQHKNILFAWLFLLPFLILALLLSPILIFCTAFLYTINDLLATLSFPADATHVPTFYAPSHPSDYKHFLVLAILATLFGGIHCIGWNFPFHTYTEQNLWRAAALAVTALPIASFVAAIPLLKHPNAVHPGDLVSMLFLYIAIILYAPARLVLLVQALALLRNLPASAFVAIDWIKFVPHIS